MSKGNRYNLKVKLAHDPDDPEAQSPTKSVPKFQHFALLLTQINQSVKLRIPETLIKLRGRSEELYYNLGKTGEVVVERQRYEIGSAVEVFLAAIRRARILDARVRASPFHLPTVIVHLPDGCQVLFTESQLHKVLTSYREFVIQRFIPSSHQRACKHRILWSKHKPLAYSTIVRKVGFPFNSPTVPPRVRERTTSQTDSRLRHLVNTQQLKFPNLLSGSKSTIPGQNSPLLGSRNFSAYSLCVLQQEESPYTVSFGSPSDFLPDESLNVELQEAAESLIYSLKFICSLSGFDLSSLHFDLIHGHDNLWYFVDLKNYSFEAIDGKIREKLRSMGHETKEVRSGSPLKRALEDLKGFFMSEKPLSGMKAPYIDKQAVVDQSVQLYRRFSLPSLF